MDKRKLFLSEEEKAELSRRKKIRAGRLLFAVVLVCGWEGLVRLGWLDSYFWSCPTAIAEAIRQLFRKGSLIKDILYTSGETILGFLGGTVLGSAVGLGFWWSKTAAGISEPYLVLFNAVPKMALGPVLVILFGIGFPSKVILAFLMTVVNSAVSAYSGVRSVDPALETLLSSLGARRGQIFTKVVVPWSMPWIISCLRVNIALALAGAIVGEYISSRHGVGRMIINAGTVLDITMVWAGVVILSVLSMVMYGGVVLLEKWLSRHCSAAHS